MQIFICAAGIGSRLSTLTNGAPKVLLEINGHTIIEYLLKIVTNHKNITEINIIVGYKYNKFINMFGSSYAEVPIKYHINSIFYKTNNLYSLFCAKDYMNNNDIIFMTADLIISPKLVHNFLSEKTGNRILTDNNKLVMDSDVVKLISSGTKVVTISKEIKRNRADGAAIGLYRLDQEGKEIFFKIAENLFKNNKYDSGFIEPIPYMTNICPFEISTYTNFTWFDVDTPSDFEKAQRVIPKLYSDIWNK